MTTTTKLTTQDKIAVLELAKIKLGRGGKNWVKGTWFGRGRYVQDSIPLAASCEGPFQDATCFCLEGAIEIAAYELGFSTRPQKNDRTTAAVSVKDYIRKKFEFHRVHSFNDDLETSWKDVLGVVNGRLRELRKELES